MMNNNQGGLDPSNARTFSSQFASAGQGQGGFSLGGNLGLHNIPVSYSLQNSLPQNRVLSGLPAGGSQQQSRFAAQTLPGGLQQYSQVANRGGLPVMNGLSGSAVNRGGGSHNLQPTRGQGSGLGGLASLGANLQRQNPQALAGLGNLGQRGMATLGLGGGAGGHLSVQQLGSPARSTGLGLGYPGMGQAGLASAHQPSGDLLAMINKSAGGGPMASLGALGQGFGAQQQQQQQQLGSVQNSTAATQSQEKEQLAFDASDFPALGGARAQAMTNGESSGALEGQNLYASLGIHKGMLPSEFNIQSEEFPALPGASAAARSATEERSSEQQQQPGPSPQAGHITLRQEVDGPQRGGQGLYDLHASGQTSQQQPASSQEQLLRFYQMQGRIPAGLKAGGATAPGMPTLVSQSQAGRAAPTLAAPQPDRFGLLGLLSVIRMTDPDLTTLALGTDLTTLGLHLNSPDNVYKTFASPWADQPLKAEPDYQVPDCYCQAAPRLKPGYFSKFQQDTLFYIFYSMPADEAQVFAADELASRGWCFHKELKLWLTRAPGTEPNLKSAHVERGSYLVFDTSLWEVVRKDNFLLGYETLERPPSLPRPAAQQAAHPSLGLK